MTASPTRRAGTLMAAFLASILTLTAARADTPVEKLPAEDCRLTTEQAERAYRIPAQLLSAISLAEAGRWDTGRQENIAWPWTVYAEGKGTYYPDKASALAAVQGLRSRGVTNIDVGCMQINLYHHGKAFDDIEQALDPERNIDYAATFLSQLQQAHRSWTEAVARYHSSTPGLNQPYKMKVMGLWHDERRAHGERRRAEVMAAYKERRERARRLKAGESKLAAN